MKKVYIIHGLGASPNSNWKPYLMRELAKRDIWACSLAMPKADDQNCDEWVETITKAVDTSDENYFVAHSLGVRAVLRYLETVEKPIEGAVLVAGRYGKPRSGVLASFYDTPLDIETLKQQSKHYVVIHGDDDPNVPYEDGVTLSRELGCELITIKDGGHLSTKAGCFELPEARDALFNMMKI
jgi:predicted alpha/beta hydrolase family esterase